MYFLKSLLVVEFLNLCFHTVIKKCLLDFLLGLISLNTNELWVAHNMNICICMYIVLFKFTNKSLEQAMIVLTRRKYKKNHLITNFLLSLWFSEVTSSWKDKLSNRKKDTWMGEKQEGRVDLSLHANCYNWNLDPRTQRGLPVSLPTSHRCCW